MKVWLFLSAIFYTTVCFTGNTQPATFSPTSLLSHGSVYQWTGENGLISNNITSAIQSSDGFIWITTYNGIMRFDGKRIVVYDRTTIPFLETDAFYRVYEDAQGTLWFASQGSGITIYKDKSFQQIEARDGKIPKSIRSILLEADGSVWIGANNEGLYQLSADRKLTRINHEKLNTINILDIAKDSKGVLWLATDGNGVVAYDGESFRNYTEADGLMSNTINTIAIGHADDVYVGTSDGLNILSDGAIRAADFLQNIPVNDLLVDAHDTKWIATENGLARINGTTGIEEFANRKNGFPYTRLNAIHRDAEGSLWISTGRDGLLQLRETGIINIGERQNVSDERINIITEGANKRFYIGSDIGTIDVYEDGNIRKLPFKTDLKDAGIRDVHEDTNGTLWIATYKGILRLNSKQEKLMTLDDGLPAIDMRRILSDGKGNLWFASRSGGLAKYSLAKQKVVRVYNKGNGLDSNYILSLEQDSTGTIYVGTHSGGLTLIQPDGSTQTHHITQNDAGVLIFNIHIENPDKVWLVCNTGPHFFNGSTFKKITLAGINKGETFFDWVVDEHHDVWITTNLGVLKITKNELEQFLVTTNYSLKVKLFDNQDGMQNKECTGATRALLSSTGKVWIPTIGGVSVFYPDKIYENKLIPPVFITDLVSDQNTFVHDTIIIEPGNLRYVFNYTALSYLAPSKLKFKYQLSKVDREWVEAGTKREAEYTNLSPGTYTFRVIACNNDGVWNTQGATMVITVKPFFYQTTWFYIASLLFGIAVLYSVYRWRLFLVERRNKELNKLNDELDRFVYSASHDLRAPLASILGLIAVARIDDQKNIDEYLNLIEKSIQKLDSFIHDIIDFSRNSRTGLVSDRIDFEPLIHDIIDELKYMDEKGQIKKIVDVNGSGDFYTDKKRLAIILRNLISNAYKYHNFYQENCFVKVSVHFTATEARITIEDNGIGISSEHLPNIFKMFYRGSENNKGSGLGLYIVKETVDKIKGKIAVRSVPEKGTLFELIVQSQEKGT